MNPDHQTDIIELRDLEVETIIGVLPDERRIPQKVYIDLSLSIDLAPAAKSCDISHTVDYAAVSDELRFVMQASQFLLLETAAYAIAQYVLAPPIGPARTQAENARVSIRKPRALGHKGVPIVTVHACTERLHYEKTREEGHYVESIFQSKDSVIHRIEMIEGKNNPPPLLEHAFQDYDLKTSGPHFLRVYRL